MLQEADARYTERINQVAASVTEQLKALLPPPALPTDGDMEEDGTTDVRAGGPTPAPAEDAPAIVSPTARAPQPMAEAGELESLLTLLRTSAGGAPNGTAAAAAAHAEALAADCRRAVVEEELCAELRAQLNVPRGRSAAGPRS
jgi:hypothetical protein